MFSLGPFVSSVVPLKQNHDAAPEFFNERDWSAAFHSSLFTAVDTRLPSVRDNPCPDEESAALSDREIVGYFLSVSNLPFMKVLTAEMSAAACAFAVDVWT
jgi:hypothetical protein